MESRAIPRKIRGKTRGHRTRATMAVAAAVLTAVTVTALLALVPGSAGAADTTKFHAVFHDTFPSSCAPPTVFCGSGSVARYGSATTVVRAGRPTPIPGTACANVAGTRSITLDDGSGTLVSSFTGTRCPRGRKGHVFKITFDSVIDGQASSGIFAGATGGGPGYTTSNRNRQTYRLKWDITLQ